MLRPPIPLFQPVANHPKDLFLRSSWCLAAPEFPHHIWTWQACHGMFHAKHAVNHRVAMVDSDDTAEKVVSPIVDRKTTILTVVGRAVKLVSVISKVYLPRLT